MGGAGRRRSVRGRDDGGREVAEARASELEREAEPAGAATGRRDQRGIVGLGEVDEAAVVAEVDRQQLGMSVEAEARDDQPVEVAGEEIGQEERAELLVGDRREGRGAGVELVAVGARQALDALLGQDRVEQAAGPAVGVGHEDVAVARARGLDLLAHEGGDPPGRLWRVAGRQVRSTLVRPAWSMTATSSRASAPQPMTRTRSGSGASEPRAAGE